MSDISAPGRPAGVLLAAIDRRAKDGFTGTLLAEGPVTGTVVMVDGVTVAAVTSAAPGPEPLLLRSGRVSEEDWTSAYAEGAPHGRFGEVLVERGLLGAAGVQILAVTALADAVFALALRGVHTCAAAPPDPARPGPLLPASPGLTGDHLVRETTRRLAAAAGWQELGLTVGALLARTSHAHSADPLLEAVNGRRTPRDLAFALGRGLYPTMNALAEHLEAGDIAPVDGSGAPGPEGPQDPDDEDHDVAGELPKRLRGSSDIIRVLPFRPDR